MGKEAFYLVAYGLVPLVKELGSILQILFYGKS